MRVAWIGLGFMGLPAAKRVAAAGHQVAGYDIAPPKPEDAPGITLTGSAREAAAGCELLCIAVFSDDQVEDLLLGEAGLFPLLAQGTVVAIFTTGSIESAKTLAAAAPPGVAVLDACFSRRHEHVAKGDTILLVGGEAAALERSRPVLETFAVEIHHLGGVGTGRAVKLVNNVLWVAHNQLAADAMRLAEGLGLDPGAAMSVILRASGGSDTQNVFIKPTWRDSLAYMRRYMIKDATAAAEAARAANVELGTLGAVVEAYTAPSPGEGSAKPG